MSRINSWKCAACTYEHQFLSSRCVMCSELKGATRQQMRDFIAGKTLPKALKNNNDDEDDDDGEVEVLEAPPAARGPQHPPFSGAVTWTDTVPGSTDTAGHAPIMAQGTTGTSTSSDPTNKENLKQSSVASSPQVPPAANHFFFAQRQPGAPPRKPCSNPYVTKKSTTASKGPAASGPVNNSARKAAPASAAKSMPSSSSKDMNDDPWQHVSTATAQSRALHPSAPQRQSPTMPVTTTNRPGQSRNHLAISTDASTTYPNPVSHTHPAAATSAAAGRPPAANALSLLKDPSVSTGTGSNKKQSNNVPFVPKAMGYSKGPVPYCPEATKTWTYPQHPEYPPRQYQLEITETAVHHNTIVSLPTGLGKTLIAAVVMYNYWRWFPTGKVIFLAPTLPLVNQQVQACYKIMGIPASVTAVMTGRMPREKRMEYWRERRVFYCTPQTVQKDLVEKSPEGEQQEESAPAVASSFSNQVVCLVLDEAHKATGEYAYVKVIEQLEAAGAKFRIVGLSATPGTTIKAIQQVVQALRSSRIEARHEADPTVAPYLHSKSSEIVIVPRNDSQRQVERHLTKMLTPILEQLKQQGATKLDGNASLTPYQIHQAREFYQKRTGDTSFILKSKFDAAHKLVTLRHDAHQSLGVVRSKLMRLHNEPQRGHLATVVKGNDFKELLEMVTAATSSGDNNATLSQEHASIRNNPKLIKLSELLKEHFLRSQACGKSSRVIVFAQFRDSVNEIVLLLRTMEPAIRPHQFVGQGKPPKGSSKSFTSKSGGSNNRLDGMKQAEQQKVIQEFRNDVYNVLVCTCIGEEGLDIGEVDLIVNFDTLRSPIRMIQRTGRTGRARDGRVVCLLAEGNEQRAYEQSKQGEKTLMRALEKKTNFTLNADIPLFPVRPKERQFVQMDIGSQLHLSQVAGANSTATRKPNGSRSTKFKLDAAQEQERQQRLGKLVVLDNNATPWRTLRRVLIRHRSTQQYHGGRTMRIIQSLKCLGPTHDAANNAVKALRMNAAIYKLFPVEKPPKVDRERELLEDKIAGFDAVENQSATPESASTPSQLRPTSSSLQHVSTSQPPRVPEDPVRAESVGEMANSETIGNSVSSRPQLLPTVPLNDVSSCLPEVNKRPLGPIQNTQTITAPQIPDGQFMDARQVADTVNEVLADSRPDKLVNVTTGPFDSEDLDDKGTMGVSEPNDSISEPVFRLPTPPPSSSEEDDEDDEDENSLAEPTEPGGENDHPALRDVFNPPETAGTSTGSESRVEGAFLLPNVANVSFRLPTQPSSSEDEDSSGDEESPDVDNSIQAPITPRAESIHNYVAKKQQTPDCFDTPSSPNSAMYNVSCPKAFAGDETDDEDIPLISLRTTTKKRKSARSQKKPKKSRKTPCENSSRPNSDAASGQQSKSSTSSPLDSSPSPEITARLKRKKRLFVVEDGASQQDLAFELSGPCASNDQTPSNPASLTAKDVLQDTPDDLAARMNHPRHHHDHTSVAQDAGVGRGELTDTPMTLNPSSSAAPSQIDAMSLSCQICFSRESLDEDPLIICDGCELGFHQSCYTIEVNLGSNEPWYCDLCTSRGEGEFESKSCALCGINGGAMKRQETGWCHPICHPFMSTSSLTSRPCLQCSCEGGARCFSCTDSIHPYCAIHTTQKDHWTIVMVNPANLKEDSKATLFCPAHVNNAHTFISLHASDDKPGPLPTIRVIQTKNRSAQLGKPSKPKRLKRKKVDGFMDASIGTEKRGRERVSARVSRIENLKRRRAGAAKFVLEEAEIETGEDSDGEEDEVRRLEDDEVSNDSFINDSYELTQHFSQDNLAELDPDASGEVDFHHRALDAEREREQQYNTPLLNRRMNQTDDSQFSSSSQKGLGNMHFVRSVLEHHRQGGRSEDIEEYYRQVAKGDQSNIDLSQTSTA